jgi:Uncharacterized conserved protein
MNSIEVLIKEHDNILKMLDVIHKASLDILGGAEVNVEDFKHIVDFIRRYADKIHHGKEEDYLFRVMTKELGNIGENLVHHGMLVEHNLARLYVSQLDAALDEYKGREDIQNKLAILVAAGSYEELLRRHIEKENEVAYPFGKRQLSKEAIEWVERETKSFEDAPDNIAEREYQLQILEKLQNRYL